MQVDPRDFETVLFDYTQRHGRIVEVFPKYDFNRNPLTRYAIGGVGLGILALGLWLALAVKVSDDADEQRPFVFAMFGIVFLGAVFTLLGFGDGLRRQLTNPALIDRWFVVLQRALVIVNQGRVEYEKPIAELRVQSGLQATDPLALIESDGRPTPIDKTESGAVAELVQRIQRDGPSPFAVDKPVPQSTAATGARRGGSLAAPTAAPPCKLPYIYAWRSGWWFQEGKLVRVYRDADAVLVVHAGAFAPSRIGVAFDHVARGIISYVVNTTTEMMANQDFDERKLWLDGLTLEEIRNEAVANSFSARVDPTRVPTARADPPTSGFWNLLWASGEETLAIGGRIRFTHGNRAWTLSFFKLDEMAAALEIFRAVLGPENVAVSPTLRLTSATFAKRV